jgi:hypothetical protein
MDIFKVRILETDEYPLWNGLVDKSPQGTIFHTSSWLFSARDTSQIKTELFGAFYDDQLIGGCAIHSKKFAHILPYATTSLPLTPYGGIIIQPHESSKIREREKDEWSIIQSILSCITRKHPHFISLTMSPYVIDIRPYIWQGWTEIVKYCYIFHLSGNIEENISKNVRRSINKANKYGIIAKRKWYKEIYWNLVLNTYHKQGIKPPFSQKLLYSLIDTIQEKQNGEMWIAETSYGEVASAEIIIWDHQMVYRLSAASHDQYKQTGATSFLLFEIMNHLQGKGFRELNLMAGNTPHLAKFISSFNPELVPYYAVQKNQGIYRILNYMRSLSGRN